MPSERWLKKVETPPQKPSEASPNVSMAEIRKVAQEKRLRDSAIPDGIPTSIPDTQPDAIPTGIPEQPLDATHTSAERSVYSIMYRETISKGFTERHFGPAELMKKTGIRSRNTVHKALYGLCQKLSIEVLTKDKGYALGPRYRVFKPQEIERRRKAVGIKIDTQSKRITERGGIPASIPTSIPDGIAAAIAKNWDTTGAEIGIPGIPKIGIHYKDINSIAVEPDTPTSSSKILTGDDEAFASFVQRMSEAVKDLTGRVPTRADSQRWDELAEILITELKIAAARTTVSSVPAFLTEHLRRRLWKMDKKQAGVEGKTVSADEQSSSSTEQAKDCPDCGGTGFYYPKGFEGGVAKCKHEQLTKEGS
jgi:hypothetical protein